MSTRETEPEIDHELIEDLDRKVETLEYHHDLGDSEPAIDTLRELHHLTGDALNHID